METQEALENYGYVLDGDGVYRRKFSINGTPIFKKTQAWKRIDEGWLRFDPNNDGEEEQMPFKIGSSFEGVGGLDHRVHRDAFDWIWPDEEVNKIYVGGLEAEAADLRARIEAKEQQAQNN